MDRHLKPLFFTFSGYIPEFLSLKCSFFLQLNNSTNIHVKRSGKSIAFRLTCKISVLSLFLLDFIQKEKKKNEFGSYMLFKMLSFCNKKSTVLSFSLKQSFKLGLPANPQHKLVSIPFFYQNISRFVMSSLKSNIQRDNPVNQTSTFICSITQ